MAATQDSNPQLENAKATLNDATQQIKAHPVVKQSHERFLEYMAQLDKEVSALRHHYLTT